MIGRARYRFTPAARRDIVDILAQTEVRFGMQQHDAYAALLASAMELVGREPSRLGSKDRGDLENGLRSFPLALAGRRRRAASHVLYYRLASPDGEGIEILRVLHQSMDPQSRLGGALG